jgi:endo-1,4-beta-xylanase
MITFAMGDVPCFSAQNRKAYVMAISRRNVLTATAALAATPLLGSKSRAKNPPLSYGAASMVQNFRDDPAYREALKTHCDIIVPMNDLKWEQLRHDRAGFDFKDADEQIAFATANGKTVRGHTLVWYNALPPWVETIETKEEAERELISHIETVVDRYKDTIPSWDVTNEVIAHDPLETGIWRESVWLKHLGPEHVALAFRTAGRVAPATQLVFNDYDLENEGPRFDARRQAILDLVRRFRDTNVPIHAIGFQAHLYAERPIDKDGVARFVRDLKALDVGILVTELDVIDWRLPADMAQRDEAAAMHVTSFLEALGAEGNLKEVISWGITDRYSWISEAFKRDDGLPPRPLPLDENYQPKPMMNAINRLRGKG